MSMHEYQLQVLMILSENLHNLQPQLVPTTAIADEMEIQLSKLHNVLNTMHSMGLIQTNPDLQYNLITRQGLNFLSEQKLPTPGYHYKAL